LLATYKRARFSCVILSVSPGWLVTMIVRLIVIAGKVNRQIRWKGNHPSDSPAKSPEFKGRVIYLENYDKGIAC
jgi:hypothetical protein